jgi:hypothetical protein
MSFTSIAKLLVVKTQAKLPSKSARFEMMIVRRVLSQQNRAIAKGLGGLLNSSRKRTFLIHKLKASYSPKCVEG